MIGLIPLAAFIVGLHEAGVALGQTMAFATLMFAQLVHVRNLHSNTRSSLAISPLKNKPLIVAIAFSAGLALLVLLIPAIRGAFRLVPLDRNHWIAVILMSLIPIVVVDLFKFLKINTTRDEKSV
jgi:Ca2+-transporting ATPase